MYDSTQQQAASPSGSNNNAAAAAVAGGGAQGSTSTAAQQSALTQQQLQQQQFAQEFWEEQIAAAEQFDSDFKNHPLPLARIKKVMKSDPDVKMISAEAPILFSKACEIFICEITRRAWLHAEDNKRRTLQRSDVANAVSKSDQFDFLIDIVPREEPMKTKTRANREEQPAPDVYADQYAHYYPQSAGGLAGYPHFYQPVSQEQFQQYIQYQQAAAAQSYQAHPSAHQPGSSRGGSAGYQEAGSRQG
ncbi:hypothetical protein BGZ73_001356 [Actinomortierella ambigua]|nr:hypothetical protein BGZ73_001356 [Actinomortierella ambigua]